MGSGRSKPAGQVRLHRQWKGSAASDRLIYYSIQSQYAPVLAHFSPQNSPSRVAFPPTRPNSSSTSIFAHTSRRQLDLRLTANHTHSPTHIPSRSSLCQSAKPVEPHSLAPLDSGGPSVKTNQKEIKHGYRTRGNETRPVSYNQVWLRL